MFFTHKITPKVFLSKLWGSLHYVVAYFFTLQPTTKKMITAVLTNVNEVHKFKHPKNLFATPLLIKSQNCKIKETIM